MATTYEWLPSATTSSTPVTVTFCATFQLTAVKTSAAGETVPSAGSLDESGMVTSAAGWEASTTVKVTDAPASDVEVPLGAETVIAAASSSLFVNGRSFGSFP